MPEFKELWRQYYPRLLFYADGFSGLSPADREDCVQDIFVTVYRKLDSYDERWAFSTWLYRIARNRLIDCQRAGSSRRYEPLEEIGDIPAQRTRWETAIDLRLDLAKAGADLKDGERELMHLFYGEDLDIAEIADILGVPRGTVKSRLHALRQKLKSRLESSYGWQ
jgi:RNA polymerase sigma factor (sigma-70 family)